jgi:lipopolysaccharide heptosyltransferase II
MNIPRDNLKKILCIKPRGIGDILLSTIVLVNIKSSYPDAVIDYLTEGFAKASLDNHALVNKVLTMGKTEFPLNVAMRIRKEKYDLILDLWSNPRSAMITFLSGVKYRVGFGYRGRKYAYNILATSSRGDYHSAEHNLELLKVLEIPVVSKDVKYYTSEEDKTFAKDFMEINFKSSGKVLGVIPSGGWNSKRCDKEKWVEIINRFEAEYSFRTLILWGPGDEDDAYYIKKQLPSVVLAPKTGLNKMASLIEKCSMVIANDSGPMHISAALGVPTLGIFGPTNPKAHGPYSKSGTYVIKEDLSCIICNLLECPYQHECMRLLSVDEVIKASENIMVH